MQKTFFTSHMDRLNGHDLAFQIKNITSPDFQIALSLTTEIFLQ